MRDEGEDSYLQIATLILFMLWSCQEHKQSSTSLAHLKKEESREARGKGRTWQVCSVFSVHLYLSKLTSCKIRSLQIVSSTFFCSCWCWGNVSMASRSAWRVQCAV